MKSRCKLILVGILMVALILGTVAMAEIDLSGMSYEELVELRNRINKAIVDSGEGQEVTVPQGTYTFGEDIPAGKWTFTYVGEELAELIIEYIDEDKYYGDNFLLEKTDETCNVQCVNGDKITIKWDAVTIKPFKGIEF